MTAKTHVDDIKDLDVYEDELKGELVQAIKTQADLVSKLWGVRITREMVQILPTMADELLELIYTNDDRDITHHSKGHDRRTPGADTQSQPDRSDLMDDPPIFITDDGREFALRFDLAAISSEVTFGEKQANTESILKILEASGGVIHVKGAAEVLNADPFSKRTFKSARRIINNFIREHDEIEMVQPGWYVVPNKFEERHPSDPR